MKRFKDISFINKLHAVIIGTTVVALLLFASVIIVYEVITYRTSTVAKIQTVADIISNSVAPALLFDDPDYGKRLLRTLREEPHIAIAALYHTGGRLFADYYRDPLPKGTQLPFTQREGFYFSANYVEVSQPVQSEGGSVGTLYIRYDLKEMQARFKQYTVIILIVLIASFVIAFIIASRMERIITDPILHLAQVASTITREKDYTIRVDKQWGDDEVGTLVSGFNQMLARIEERDRALETSEERFRRMADNIPSGIMIIEEGKTVYVNDQACRICGYPKEELMSLWGPDLTAPRESEKKERLIQKVRETDTYPDHIDTWIICKDGTERCVNLRFSFSRQRERTYVGYVVITDITDRKRAEDALLETRDFLSNIIDSSLDPIVIGDSRGNITRVNKAFVNLVCFDQEELFGRHMAELVPPHAGFYQSTDGTLVRVDESFYDRAYEQMCTLIEKGNLAAWESCYFRKDGTIIPVEQTMFYIYDKQGERMAVITINRDISERKSAERKLYEYQNQLRSLASQLTLTEEQERKRIATEIHDSISQSLALAKIKLGALTKAVSSKATHDVAAIRSLLEQSIQDTRSIMFDLSPPFLYEFGLKKAMEWVLENIEKQHGIKARLAWNDHEESYDDDVRIIFYQSIRELLMNVVKHAQAKNVTVAVAKDDRCIRFSVEDDGRGFLVDPDGFKAGSQGGYGLFSIRERFQHLGGSLTVASRLNQGTRIDLELPLVHRTA